MIRRFIHTFSFIWILGNLAAQSPSIGGYNVYYGHLQNHNAIGTSYALGSHEDAYNFARNVAGLDFFSTSNHWIYMTDPDWDSIKAVADRYNEDGVFSTFWGFEYESIGGDLTIINTAEYASVSDPLCTWFENQGGIAFINHPYGVQYALFENYPPCERIVGMELFNKTDGFDVYFYPNSYYNDANRGGWRIGASGSDDNHKGTWGIRTDWRMAVLSENLSREALFSAMQARRFYSTLDKNLALSLKIDSVEMGATIGAGIHTVQIQAKDDLDDPFTKVILYKNGREWDTWDINTPFVDFSKSIETNAEDFYYVKVTQADGDEAISSPVYIIHRPLCSITTPESAIHYTSPRAITINAEASDHDGTVEMVDFYVNGSLIGSDSLPPYLIDYTIPAEGLYEIIANVRDNEGFWGSSASTFFTVGTHSKSVSYQVGYSEDDVTIYDCWISFCREDSAVYLGKDGSNIVRSRIRFRDLYVPPGIEIESAYIQFTAKEADTRDCSVSIRGIWSGNTNAEVIWEPPAWQNAGDAGPDQRTPDLSSIIQEIVNHPDYSVNSDITINLTTKSTGQRTAVSYEYSQAHPDQFADAAAVLTVNYSLFPEVYTNTATVFKATDLKLYPNPVRDQLTIETSSRERYTVEISSLNGQLLYRTQMEESTQQIDLSSFRQGVYFITVRSRDFVRTEKIIKL